MNLGFDLSDWENTQAIEMGEFETLDLGGHIVKIKSAELYTSQISGNTSLKVCVDTSEEDKQPGFFQKQYDNNENADKKWSNGATRYLSLKKESLAYTKGFISSLEKSNSGFKFNTSKGWEQLVGLKCVGVFGLEEYTNNEGQNKMATRLKQFRSIDKLNEVKIPPVKFLDGTTIEYEIYKNRSNDVANIAQLDPVVEINPQNLPF